MNTPLIHECTQCHMRYALENLPTADERVLSGAGGYIGFGRYVFAVCPKCGHKDWASERRYFGILGPRGFYTLVLCFVVAFLAALLLSEFG